MKPARPLFRLPATPATPREPLQARSLSVATCNHGTVFVRLHDADGAIFAAASMDPHTAVAFLDQLTTLLEALTAGDGPPCGHVH